MTLYTEEKKSSVGKYIFIGLFLTACLLLANYPEWELRYRNAQVKNVPPPAQFNIKTIEVTKEGSPSPTLHSRLVQHLFSQAGSSTGPSPDELSLKFSAPVDIQGILMSVDCWKSTRLVEFAAGINNKPAYQANGPTDMLLHVSFATNLEAGKIDEQVWFPKPFRMNPEDSLNIGAWIENVSPNPQNVSPEIIVYYTWVGSDNSSLNLR